VRCRRGRVNTGIWQILILVGNFTEKSSLGDFFTSKYPPKAIFTGKSLREECAIQLYGRF